MGTDADEPGSPPARREPGRNGRPPARAPRRDDGLEGVRAEIARAVLDELASEWRGEWTTEALLAELVRRAGGEGS